MLKDWIRKPQGIYVDKPRSTSGDGSTCPLVEYRVRNSLLLEEAVSTHNASTIQWHQTSALSDIFPGRLIVILTGHNGSFLIVILE